MIKMTRACHPQDIRHCPTIPTRIFVHKLNHCQLIQTVSLYRLQPKYYESLRDVNDAESQRTIAAFRSSQSVNHFKSLPKKNRRSKNRVFDIGAACFLATVPMVAVVSSLLAILFINNIDLSPPREELFGMADYHFDTCGEPAYKINLAPPHWFLQPPWLGKWPRIYRLC